MKVFISKSKYDDLRELNQCVGHDFDKNNRIKQRRAFGLLSHTHRYGALSHVIIFKDKQRNEMDFSLTRIKQDPDVYICLIGTDQDMNNLLTKLFMII
jgi:hypothetical protein